jgi:hypothetical protein
MVCWGGVEEALSKRRRRGLWFVLSMWGQGSFSRGEGLRGQSAAPLCVACAEATRTLCAGPCVALHTQWRTHCAWRDTHTVRRQSYGQLLAREVGEDEGPGGAGEPAEAEAETGRRHGLEASDAVGQVPLARLLEQRLGECRAACGDDAFTRAMATVDGEVLQQLQRLARDG